MGKRTRTASDDVNSQHNKLLRTYIRLQCAPNVHPESRHFSNSILRWQADCNHSRVSSCQKDVMSHSETYFLKPTKPQKQEETKKSGITNRNLRYFANQGKQTSNNSGRYQPLYPFRILLTAGDHKVQHGSVFQRFIMMNWLQL